MTDTYRLADVNVRVSAIHPAVHALCSGYAADGPADFDVRIRQTDINGERRRADRPGNSDAYLETLAVLRKIAEKLPGYDAFLFHGSAVAVDGQAYIFTAPSGTGKSTHTRLWRALLGGRAVMVNDDKPLIRVQTDGTATVYGSPWDGKHRLSSNIAVPVRAICVLGRSGKNRIRETAKAGLLPMLVQQTYRPADPAMLARTLTLLDRLSARFYRLECNMDLSAAELSYGAMALRSDE